MKRTFEMKGKTYESMMAIAKELGVKRVYPKDFSKYGITEVTGQENTQEVPKVKTEVKTSEPEETVKAEEPKTSEVSEPVKEETEEIPQKLKIAKKAEKAEKPAKVTKKTAKADAGEVTEAEINEVIKKTTEFTLLQFNDIIGKWNSDTLAILAEKAGVNTWANITSNPIRKMRLLMEIKKFYYPNDKIPVKPDSPWKNIPLDNILSLADSKGIQYNKTGEPKTQRMWVIYALTKEGVTPDEVKLDDVAATDDAAQA